MRLPNPRGLGARCAIKRVPRRITNPSSPPPRSPSPQITPVAKSWAISKEVHMLLLYTSLRFQRTLSESFVIFVQTLRATPASFSSHVLVFQAEPEKA